MLRAITSSYSAFPMGSVIQTSSGSGALVAATSQIFVIGWRIAVPVFVGHTSVEVNGGTRVAKPASAQFDDCDPPPSNC
jgi:flagellar biosynthesis protein FliR